MYFFGTCLQNRVWWVPLPPFTQSESVVTWPELSPGGNHSHADVFRFTLNKKRLLAVPTPPDLS